MQFGSAIALVTSCPSTLSSTTGSGLGIETTIALVAALAAVAAGVAALVAALLTYSQLKLSRFALGVDLLLRLEAEFDSSEMQEARDLAAKALRGQADAKEIEPVLDFFDTLGLLVRRKALDLELAWNSFSYWALRYHALTKSQIQARRKEESDDTYWEEFENLASRMRELDARKLGRASSEALTAKQRADFLDEETKEDENEAVA